MLGVWLDKTRTVKSYNGGNSIWKVMNVFRTGFWGNGCEQVLNSHCNAEASQSCQRPAPQAIFSLERSDNVIARRTRYLRDFSVFFYLTSDPQKRGVYVTFVWWWIFWKPCERVWGGVAIFNENQTVVVSLNKCILCRRQETIWPSKGCLRVDPYHASALQAQNLFVCLFVCLVGWIQPGQ